MKTLPVSLILATVSFFLFMVLGPNSGFTTHLLTIYVTSMIILVATAYQSKQKGDHQNV
jgi:hypothetical protein